MRRSVFGLATAFLMFWAAPYTQALRVAQGTQGPAAQTPKRPPQAKTQQEYKDYNAAYAVVGGAAMEKAANEFAAKYPQSELRSYLYAKAMRENQNENNPGKMLAMAEKVLALDPDNSIALVLTATVLADSLSDADQGREQKIAEIKKNVMHALETVDSSFVPPASATPEQMAAYKNTLRSMARSALGIMELKTGDDAGAERDLKEAAELTTPQPDPYILYHLALSQDRQKKYIDAMASVNEALRHTSSNPELAQLAQRERERLLQLTGTRPAPQTKPSPQS
jgi:tetratricopeptide (TPR) repeat protein